MANFAASLPLDVDTSIRLQDDIAETLITVVYVNNKRGDSPFDAIVLATHGRHGIPRWLLGSVTEHIMSHTHLPMLIVRHAPSDQPEISHVEES